ncbi:unnamed protein product [Urochloa humidicola]
MQLSLVATPLDATSAAPSVADIYEVIEDLCGKCYLPTLISTYAPDFILHFESEESRDVVHRLKVLPVLSSGLSLSMWTPYYRSQVIAWETEVEICVSNIPVEACHPDILLPLLSSRCDIRSYNFDKSKGTCQLVAFTSMPAAIPKSASIAYPVRTPVRTILMTHPVSISTRAAAIPSDRVVGHPLFRAFCVEYPNYDWKLLQTAFEFGVDPDVLFEAYRDIDEAEDILEGRVNRFDDTSSSDCSMDYDGYSARMMDHYSPSDDLSDREPADWKGRNM